MDKTNPEPYTQRYVSDSSRFGPYCRTMPRALWRSWGGGQFLTSEEPLFRYVSDTGGEWEKPNLKEALMWQNEHQVWREREKQRVTDRQTDRQR